MRHDKKAYRGRDVAERFFGGMKEWSCLAMRRDKNDSSFLSLLGLSACSTRSRGLFNLENTA